MGGEGRGGEGEERERRGKGRAEGVGGKMGGWGRVDCGSAYLNQPPATKSANYALLLAATVASFCTKWIF